MRPEATTADADALAQDPRLLVKAAKAGQHVVRLFSGDPFLFGHATAEVAACAKARVPFEVVPGVPTATAVPAYAGIPLTSDASGDVRVFHASEASRVQVGPGQQLSGTDGQQTLVPGPGADEGHPAVGWLLG